MSKSRGNLVFVSKLRAEGVDPNAVRLALASPPTEVLSHALEVLAVLARGTPEDTGVE
jgi:methionyl-tRNA synthetase